MTNPTKRNQAPPAGLTVYGKIPPQAIEVEEAVLGALMLERDAIHRLTDIIDSVSFYRDQHRLIFDVAKSLAADKKPVDLLTITQRLKDIGKLEEIGGPAYITQLTRHVASAAHVEFHARIIAQKFIQRELIRVSSEIQADSFDDMQDVDELLSNAKSKIGEIDTMISNANAGQTSQQVVAEEMKELEKDSLRASKGKIPGITTGLRHLDEVTGGWRRGDLIILAARPSVGKSSLSFFFDKIAAENGYWVNHYSFEMKNGKIFRISLSVETGISRSAIRDGRLSPEDWMPINAAAAKIRERTILWNDNPKLTAASIQSITRRNVKAGRCDFVVIDYLQLTKPSDKKMIREQQVSEFSRTFKDIAMECNIPVLALSQLNRDIEKRSDKEPTLADLRESGAIEQDADVIIFFWDKENPKLKVEKQRNGQIGLIDFWANRDRTVFRDSPPHDGFGSMPEIDFETGTGRADVF